MLLGRASGRKSPRPFFSWKKRFSIKKCARAAGCYTFCLTRTFSIFLGRAAPAFKLYAKSPFDMPRILLSIAAAIAAAGAALSFFASGPSAAADADDERLWLSSQSWLQAPSPAETHRELRLGVSVFALPNLNDPIIEHTVAELRRKLPHTVITVAQLWQDELADAVANGHFDLVLTSASFYFAARQIGLRDLATVVQDATPFPNEAEGGVIIVRKDRKDLKTIDDLQGKRLAVNYPHGIFNYHINMGEIASRGYEWKHFFSDESHVGSYAEVTEEVRSGRADVGFLKTCILEQTELGFSGEFRVIEPREKTRIACAASTALYPNWTLSITPHAPQALAGLITSILLQMPPMAEGGLHWDVATDFSSIDRLFRELKIWHYDYLNDEWSVRRIVGKYWTWFMPVILLILILLTHGWIVERQVRRKTDELVAAARKQHSLEQQAQAAGERLEALRRAGVTGQLSSIFVHEVRQPLASIGYLVRGTQRLAEKGPMDYDRLNQLLERIGHEVERIDTIVERVRSYSKRGSRKREAVNLSYIARAVVKDFSTSGRIPQTITTDIDEDIVVTADAFEMQVMIHNLIRNAAEAMASDVSHPIEVSLKKDEAAGMCRLAVRDHGPKLTDEQLEGLQEALHSSKAGGLGLGVAIIRSILEAHQGDLHYTPLETGGLLACASLPIKSGYSLTVKKAS